MKQSMVAIAAILTAGLMAAPSPPRAGFTRGSHTTRRRINPVRPYVPTDPDIARWNANVDRKKGRA